jgi:hypothetical protein
MSNRELVATLKRLGPEHVVSRMELCCQCDGLSPALGFRADASEYIVNCSLCHSKHTVSVEDADRWREKMRKRVAG